MKEEGGFGCYSILDYKDTLVQKQIKSKTTHIYFKSINIAQDQLSQEHFHVMVTKRSTSSQLNFDYQTLEILPQNLRLKKLQVA
jgi:hypothetical protein